MKHAIVATLIVAALLVLLGRIGREPDDGRPTVEFWSYGTGGADNPAGTFWDEAGQRFEAASPGTHIRIVADIPHGPYSSILTARFVAGQAPDVFVIDDNMLAELANEDLLMPLDEYIRQDPSYRTEDFPPSMVNDGYVGDRRYSIPWYGGYGCLFYRTDVFAAAGVTPPRTWDELLAVCRTLQEKQGLQYPLAFSPTTGFWMMPWIWQNGGRLYNPELTRSALDTPEVIGAVQFVHDLLYRHRVMDPGLAQGAQSGDQWRTGKAVMVIDGGWNVARYDKLYPDLRGKWEVAMLPGNREQVSFFGGQHLVMNRRCRQPDLAWRFMAYVTAPPAQFRWAAIVGSPPGNLQTLRLPEFQAQFPHFAILPEIMRHGRNNPFAPFFLNTWYGRFQSSVLETVMKDPQADEAKIASTVRTASREIQQAIDDYWRVQDHATYRVQGRETTAPAEAPR